MNTNNTGKGSRGWLLDEAATSRAWSKEIGKHPWWAEALEEGAAAIAIRDDLLEALRAISNQARPRALVPGGPCREYILDRKEMEFVRAALAKAGKRLVEDDFS